MNLESIVTIPVISAIVYAIVDIVKTATNGSEKFKRLIPLFSAATGAIIGLIAFKFVPGVLDTQNAFIALVLGAASGLSATGTDQAIKQLSKGKTGTGGSNEQ